MALCVCVCGGEWTTSPTTLMETEIYDNSALKLNTVRLHRHIYLAKHYIILNCRWHSFKDIEFSASTSTTETFCHLKFGPVQKSLLFRNYMHEA